MVCEISLGVYCRPSPKVKHELQKKSLVGNVKTSFSEKSEAFLNICKNNFKKVIIIILSLNVLQIFFLSEKSKLFFD